MPNSWVSGGEHSGYNPSTSPQKTQLYPPREPALQFAVLRSTLKLCEGASPIFQVMKGPIDEGSW